MHNESGVADQSDVSDQHLFVRSFVRTFVSLFLSFFLSFFVCLLSVCLFACLFVFCLFWLGGGGWLGCRWVIVLVFKYLNCSYVIFE